MYLYHLSFNLVLFNKMNMDLQKKKKKSKAKQINKFYFVGHLIFIYMETNARVLLSFKHMIYNYNK